ncbi:MAG: MFS transporter [Chlamydiota bacterium]
MKIPKIVYLLISGILFVKMALFMSYPYLALYLTELHFSAIDIGIILGSHYLCAGLIGVFGGYVADLISPKNILIFVLMIGSAAFFGLSRSETFIEFLICSCILAVSIATFEPIAAVLVTSNSPPSLHALVFRYRYMANNIGAALGPFIGTLFYLKGSQFPFYITCLLLTFYAFIFLFIKISPPKELIARSSKNLKEALSHMKQNKPFLFLMGANFFITMTYIQIFSTMPQILHGLEGGRYLYSILITLNPIIVIATGLFFNQFLIRQSLKNLFGVGAVLLAVSFLGFHFAPVNFPNYIFFMILFTLAEVLLVPSTSKFLLDLSIEEYKGAYLGAESSSYIGFFVGNLVGGLLLQYSQYLFLFCAISAVVGFFFYRFSYQKQVRNLI